MAAPTEIYVDPAIAADSGTGTIGDPYGDTQFALNTATRDATNGNRFNIKAGTAEILAAIPTLATYGTPTADAPLIFEGYTSAAGDTGQGDINGNGGNFSAMPSVQFVICRHLKIRNTGTATIIDWSSLDWNIIEFCEFDTCANTASVVHVGSGRARFNNFAGGFTGGGAILMGIAGCNITGNYIASSDNVLAAINLSGADRWVCQRNIISFTNSGQTGIGIRVNSVRGGVIDHNSIFVVAGTGRGILLNSTGADGAIITNNLIEGLSGAGGDGIEVTAGSFISEYGYNGFYNNTADETGVSTTTKIPIGGNELAIASSPFAKSGANSFANRATYFGPAAVGSVRGGAYPTALRLDKGAVQHADPAGGGGMLVNPGMSGRLV